MSWSRPIQAFNTVRLRLTLWYALLFVVIAVALLLTETETLKREFGDARDDALLADLRQFSALYHEFGLQALAGDLRRAAEARGTENAVMVFRGASLAPLATSPLEPWQGVFLDAPDLVELKPGDVRFRTLPVAELRLTLRLVEACLDDGNYLQIGQVETDAPAVHHYRSLFYVVIGGMLVLGVGLGWLLIGRAMAGVERVTQTAAGIGLGDLASRVPHLGRGREIDALVDAFNAMLDRVAAVVTELREVTDNIAHDLRSPLTRIRGLMETVSVDGESLAAYQEARGAVIEECDRLVQFINTMLDIAEANADVPGADREAVDLGVVLREAHELFEPVAEERGIRFSLDLAEPVPAVAGERRKVQRIVANLLDNAFKFTPAGGQVALTATVLRDLVEICVADTGCGIPEADLPHVFDRFFRGESSRTTPGNGLGLALVQALTRACGGEVSLKSEMGKGSSVVVSLPLAGTLAGALSPT